MNGSKAYFQKTPAPAIVAQNLTKSYHGNLVLDHINLTIKNAEIFALLGPNGAGKTTAVEILEGYRVPDAGFARVIGLDPVRDGARLKPQMGVMLQEDGIYPGLTARELLRLFASYFAVPRDTAELLDRTGLTPSADVRSRRLSGGQKRRLALALALVGRPSVLFLDEPTTGMDPQARLATWRIIQEERKRGATVLLTTQSMEEAERLADRVAIINRGTIVALDRPQELTRLPGPGVVRVSVPSTIDVDLLKLLPSAIAVAEVEQGTYAIATDDPAALLVELTTCLRDRNVTVSEIKVGSLTLEEVFLRLTGHEQRS